MKGRIMDCEICLLPMEDDQELAQMFDSNDDLYDRVDCHLQCGLSEGLELD